MRIYHKIFALLILILLTLPPVFAEETTTSSTDWSIAFDFEEHFRGEKNLPRVIHLKVDQTGEYLASYHLISEDTELAKQHTDQGLLEEDLVNYLNDWIAIINQSDLPTSEEELMIGFSPSLKPGWKGQLTVTQADQSRLIKFNSLRSKTKRPVSYNQLATVFR